MNQEVQLLLKSKAEIFKALAHPTRLWIVEQLREGDRCVCELVENIDFDFSTISKHLSVLKNAGIVDSNKVGKKIFYSLKVPCIMKFIGCVEQVIKINAEEQSRIIHFE